MKRLKLLVIWLISWSLYYDISIRWLIADYQHLSAGVKGFNALCCIATWIVVAAIILKYKREN